MTAGELNAFWRGVDALASLLEEERAREMTRMVNSAMNRFHKTLKRQA